MARKLSFRVVPFAEWPKRDRSRYEMAKKTGSPLAGGGPLGAYGLDRKKKFEAAYGRWIGFLEVEGIDPAPSAFRHAARDRLLRFREAMMAELAPFTVVAYLVDLLVVARAIADGGDLITLSALLWNTARNAEPSRDDRTRLVPSRNLYDLGLALMDQAPQCRAPVARAIRYRDGLIVALLAVRPVRLNNLAAIRLNGQLEQQDDTFWLVYPGREMKNRRGLEFPLPNELTQPLETYLREYRPILVARRGRWFKRNHDALWVSRDGSALRPRRIEEIIKGHTAKCFGAPIDPHMFRKAAATSIAIEDPKHVGIVVAILNHSNPRTFEEHYNLAGAVTAANRYHKVLGF